MPRKFIKRHLPDTDELRRHSAMQALGGGVMRPQLWHLNRRSVSGAVAVGLFLGWMPVPMQMVLAAFAAMLLHVNLPISVLLVWISNPFTLPALVYAAYQTGARLLGQEPGQLTFEPTFSGIIQLLNYSWQPLLLGCLMLGAVSAVAGFLATRLLWRLTLLRRWKERQRRKPSRTAKA